MEQQRQRRRVVAAQLNTALDAEDFDSVMLELLTPVSEYGDVLRLPSECGLQASLKGSWQERPFGALQDTGDAQQAARAAQNNAGAFHQRACCRRGAAHRAPRSSHALPTNAQPLRRAGPQEESASRRRRRPRALQTPLLQAWTQQTRVWRPRRLVPNCCCPWWWGLRRQTAWQRRLRKSLAPQRPLTWGECTSAKWCWQRG